LNIRGEVVGVNTMIATQSGGYQGVGFALPINTAVKVYNMIIKTGKVTRGSIGVSFSNVDNPDLLRALGVEHGVVVSGVQQGGPAEKAGVKPEDIILAVDGKPVKSGDDLVSRVAETPVGTEVTITVDRDGEKRDFPVVIGDRAKVFADDPRFSYYRREEEPSRGEDTGAKFGISVRNLSPREREEMDLQDDRGILVTRVEMGSFAEEIGLREGDVITSINREPVSSVDDIKNIQRTLSTGDPVAFRMMRSIPTDVRGRRTQWQSFYAAGTLP